MADLTTQNRGVGRVVLTADQVRHEGDVVSRSDGFGTIATRKPVSRTISINFLDELVKAGSGPPRPWELLHQTP